ncbi:Eukaryotic translation initiation factor 3 subunit K [Melanopsichium pennsylvanicum]|uniref:Eukaryotic translation initiation factor 3 subunit K n=2 Tax=Melanopsichium pennsylvanicum TaxID=63383 RepID=A0AAJ4XRK9_9BASI|nr:related to eIF3k-translation initiation factor 3 subunit K [Melanopsichium pennsylvanicum 4]SNX87575.1 Eukaryotic translation initiation factor 3 subunit K [Melanopsichium pennsylvanicum]
MASESASASQWVSPSSRPEHIEQLISGVDRYNPQNLDVLHDYLAQQLDDGSYDLLANLAILKLYQFNPADFNYVVVVNILLKALVAAPLPDFNLCVSLLGEAPLPTIPVKAEKEVKTDDDAAALSDDDEEEVVEKPKDVASAGHITDPLIVRLSQLSTLLFQARFREFWSTLASQEYSDVREYAAKISEFENAARKVALNSVKGSFTSISEKRIGSYLNLEGKQLEDFINAQPGWKLSNGNVSVPANPDNEIKATVIREEITLDQMHKFLSQAQSPILRA